MDSCESRFYRAADRLRLHVRHCPGPRQTAPTVLCLHGLMRNARDFEDLAPRLQARYRVLAPDLRGRGLSDRDPAPQNYQVAVYLQDLEPVFAEAAAHGPYAIVGTSLGGILAMLHAATRPARLAGIVLNDIGPALDPAGVERIKGYAGRSPPARDWPEAIAQMRAAYAVAWPDLPPDRWETLARRSYVADASGALRAAADPAIGDAMRAAPAAPLDLWVQWQTLADLPVLALRGELSDLLSPAILERMLALKSDLETQVIANRGHVPLLDEPESLDAIERFLERAFGAPRATTCATSPA
jgi:pimeloyl-ACP methyl ester carboxylesterase